MFGEKLGQTLSCIGISPTEMAHFMGVDPSNISRMLTGKRLPKNGGKAAWRLVSGIFSYADESGKTVALCTLIGCENANSADTVKSRMMVWLFEGVEPPKKADRPKDRVPYRAFGEKLNAVMELAQLSNVRFGRLISVDTSYVSRFRGGLRSPKSNPKTMNAICSVLLNRLYEQNKIRELGALMKLAPENLTDEDEAMASFRNWLFDTEKGDSSSIVENLLENIDTFSLEIKTPLPSFEEAADEKMIASDDTVYFGMSGLRNAVIRFLGNAIRKSAKELYLYSDQNMEWMVGDPAFQMKWAALMLECVKHGIHIRIIHNIDRDLSEMVSAVKSWLPLYPSGMIRSYYCRRKSDVRFSSTLFLCPGHACIAGSNVIGTENLCGVYRYDTEPELLAAHRAAYDALLADSDVLIRAFYTMQIERSTLRSTGSISVLTSRLSLATMPQEVLDSLLRRYSLSHAAAQEIRAMWQRQQEFYSRCLAHYAVHECVPVVAPSDSIPADIPGVSLCYTAQEYAAHLRHMAALTQRWVGYRVYPLPQPAFDDVRVRIAADHVAVSRLTAPCVTFEFTHPTMCSAFVSYADRVKKQYHLDKITVKNLLEEFC